MPHSVPARLLAISLALALASCGGGDDERDGGPDFYDYEVPSTESTVPGESEPGSGPASTEPPAPGMTFTLDGTDERYPGSWQVTIRPGRCQEERLNAVDAQHFGCMELDAEEVNDEFGGLSLIVDDEATAGQPPQWTTIQLADSAVRLFSLVPRPSGHQEGDDLYDYGDNTPYLWCGPEWCRVASYWHWDRNSYNEQEGFSIESQINGDDSIDPADVIYVLADNVQGVTQAIRADGQDALAEVESFDRCMRDNHAYDIQVNARSCLGGT